MSSRDSGHKEYASYWSIVWEQFQKNGLSYGAFWGIFALFSVATYAPVIASKIPFVYRDADGLSFPWISSLLFNRNVFENSVDLFFNLMLIASPLLIAVFFWARWRERDTAPIDRGPFRTKVAFTTGALYLIAFVIILLIEPRFAVPEYRELAASTDVYAIFSPLRMHYDDTLFGAEGPGLRHILGMDDAGKDIFVRLVYGTRVSLSVGVIAVGIYVTIGTLLGATAGFYGGKTDIAIQRLIEIFLCFPALFLILTLVGFLRQPSIIWIMVIIGLTRWTSSARLVRGEFLRLKSIDFVSAAHACGLSHPRIIFRHILPNATGPLLVNATFGVASAILTESTLAFLGFGDPTLPSWGRILSFGRATGDTTMMLIAGIAVFVTVSTFNLAGEGLRDALDPKLRK